MALKSDSKVEKSDREVKKEAKRLLKMIEAQKKRAEKLGHNFIGLSEEELIFKIRGETSNSPFYFIRAWDRFTKAGLRSWYIANYKNPDPRQRLCFVTMFFGLSAINPDINSAISARDTRWPFVSTELTILDPGGIGVALFNFEVPYVPKGTYFINTVLWEWNPSIVQGVSLSQVFEVANGHYLEVQ